MKLLQIVMLLSIYHIISASTCAGQSNNEGSIALQNAQVLVDALLKTEANRDVKAQMQLFTPKITVDGKALSKEQLGDEKKAFYKRWPKAEWKLLVPPQTIRLISPTDYEVIYRATYRVESPARGKWSEGLLLSRLTLRTVDDKLLIAAIQDEVSGTSKGDLASSGPERVKLRQSSKASGSLTEPAPVFQMGLFRDAMFSAVDPGGVRALFGNGSELVIVDVASGKQIGRKDRSAVGQPLTGGAFSPDGRYVFLRAGGNRGDPFLRILDLDSFVFMAAPAEIGSPVSFHGHELTFHDAGLDYVGKDPVVPSVTLRNVTTGDVKVIPIATGLGVQSLYPKQNSNYPSQLFLRNGKSLYVTSDSRNIIIVDLLTQLQSASFKGSGHYVTDDRNTIAIISEDNIISGYSLEDFSLLWNVSCPVGATFAVANDGRVFIGAASGEIQVLDPLKAAISWVRRVSELWREGTIAAIKLAPDAKTLAVVVRYGDASSMKRVGVLLIESATGDLMRDLSEWEVSWDGENVTFDKESRLIAHSPFRGRFHNAIQVLRLDGTANPANFEFSSENDGMGIRALDFGDASGGALSLYFATTDYPQEFPQISQQVGSVSLQPGGVKFIAGSVKFFDGQWQSYRVTAYERQRLLATDDRDGFSTMRSLPDGQVLFRVAATHSGVPMIMSMDGFYSSRSRALENLGFRYDARAYPFEQFDLRLNRPDVVLERIGAPNEAVTIAKQLREKRLKRMGLTEEMLKPDFHLPELEILGKVPVTTDASEIDLAIKASDSKYPLERLKVFVNNVPVNGRDGESLRDQNSQTLERTIPIKLAAGRNKIQVSVLNNAGAESLYANAEVNCTAKRPKPTLYAVAMGVSEYANPDWNLKYAAKDAKDVLAKLKAGSGDNYGEVKELLLTDKEVTKESIAKVKDFLSSATIDDTVLMFVAGHGLLDSNYDYFFGTTDVDFNNPADKGIAFEEFDDLLAELPSLKKSLLIDTCHAGELDEEEKTLLASAGGVSAALPTANGVAVRSIGTRGMNVKAVEGARGASEWYDRLQGLFVDLRRGSGSTILSSSAGAEYALESSEQQNGLFTYAVLEALDGNPDADTNKDGSVQMSELGEYVKKRVSELTNNKQTPNTRRVNLEGDFVLTTAE